MGYTWENAKKAVEKYFFDKCNIAVYESFETEWGEARWIQREEKEIICRLVEEPLMVREKGLLSMSEGRATLLYPVEENLEAGSSVTVTKAGGEKKYFFTVGESIFYNTHKEAVLMKENSI